MINYHPTIITIIFDNFNNNNIWFFTCNVLLDVLAGVQRHLAQWALLVQGGVRLVGHLMEALDGAQLLPGLLGALQLLAQLEPRDQAEEEVLRALDLRERRFVFVIL